MPMTDTLPLQPEWEEYLCRKAETFDNGYKNPCARFYVSPETAKSESENYLFWLNAIIAKYGDMKFGWRNDGCELENGEFYKY